MERQRLALLGSPLQDSRSLAAGLLEMGALSAGPHAGPHAVSCCAFLVGFCDVCDEWGN